MTRWIGWAAAALLALPGAAQAAACATVQMTPATLSLSSTSWDPTKGVQGVATFTVKATRASNGYRSARIVFIDTDTGTTYIGTLGPQYEITDANSATVSAPSGTAAPSSGASGGAQFQWSNGQGNDDSTQTFTTTVLPTATRDFSSGTVFTENLRYSITCYNNMGSAQSTDTNVAAPLALSLTVPSLVSLGIASAQTIDFGAFTTSTQTLQVNLKSTGPINVAVASANVNRLVLAGSVPPRATNAEIPYAMTLNGAAIANGSTLANRSRAGVLGTNWPLVLTLTGGLPSGKIAGAYSDIITLDLTPGS